MQLYNDMYSGLFSNYYTNVQSATISMYIHDRPFKVLYNVHNIITEESIIYTHGTELAHM